MSQRALHVLDGRDAVDEPRVLVALHDLLFLVAGGDKVAHHRAHHVVEGDHAHHQAVFVDDDREVFVRLAGTARAPRSARAGRE